MELLPAQRGDCLWLTYGEPPDLHHVIVDAGPSETIATLVPELERRISALPGTTDRVELLAMSHVDADHIQGVVGLLSDPRRVNLFRDVWFNGWKHLPSPRTRGAPDGERLTTVLAGHGRRWNKSFGGGPVVMPAEAAPRPTRLAGGLELTLLSPTAEGLARLAPRWERECKRAGLLPGHGAELPPAVRGRQPVEWDIDRLASTPYRPDRAEPNGSSIAFIASYRGKSLLCAADAHSEVLEQGLDRLGPGPHELTAVKLSHHGSRANLSPGLLRRIRSRRWLVSTNGARFGHPDLEALARVVATQQKPVFHLNYVTPYVQDVIAGAGARYGVKLPPKRDDGTYESGVVVPLD